MEGSRKEGRGECAREYFGGVLGGVSFHASHKLAIAEAMGGGGGGTKG